jgi:hypothetical protein
MDVFTLIIVSVGMFLSMGSLELFYNVFKEKTFENKILHFSLGCLFLSAGLFIISTGMRV